jgi:hypothetical protein
MVRENTIDHYAVKIQRRLSTRQLEIGEGAEKRRILPHQPCNNPIALHMID